MSTSPLSFRSAPISRAYAALRQLDALKEEEIRNPVPLDHSDASVYYNNNNNYNNNNRDNNINNNNKDAKKGQVYISLKSKHRNTNDDTGYSNNNRNKINIHYKNINTEYNDNNINRDNINNNNNRATVRPLKTLNDNSPMTSFPAININKNADSNNNNNNRYIGDADEDNDTTINNISTLLLVEDDDGSEPSSHACEGKHEEIVEARAHEEHEIVEDISNIHDAHRNTHLTDTISIPVDRRGSSSTLHPSTRNNSSNNLINNNNNNNITNTSSKPSPSPLKAYSHTNSITNNNNNNSHIPVAAAADVRTGEYMKHTSSSSLKVLPLIEYEGQYGGAVRRSSNNNSNNNNINNIINPVPGDPTSRSYYNIHDNNNNNNDYSFAAQATKKTGRRGQYSNGIIISGDNNNDNDDNSNPLQGYSTDTPSTYSRMPHSSLGISDNTDNNRNDRDSRNNRNDRDSREGQYPNRRDISTSEEANNNNNNNNNSTRGLLKRMLEEFVDLKKQNQQAMDEIDILKRERASASRSQSARHEFDKRVAVEVKAPPTVVTGQIPDRSISTQSSSKALQLRKPFNLSLKVTAEQASGERPPSHRRRSTMHLIEEEEDTKAYHDDLKISHEIKLKPFNPTHVSGYTAVRHSTVSAGTIASNARKVPRSSASKHVYDRVRASEDRISYITEIPAKTRTGLSISLVTPKSALLAAALAPECSSYIENTCGHSPRRTVMHGGHCVSRNKSASSVSPVRDKVCDVPRETNTSTMRAKLGQHRKEVERLMRLPVHPTPRGEMSIKYTNEMLNIEHRSPVRGVGTGEGNGSVGPSRRSTSSRKLREGEVTTAGGVTEGSLGTRTSPSKDHHRACSQAGTNSGTSQYTGWSVMPNRHVLQVQENNNNNNYYNNNMNEGSRSPTTRPFKPPNTERLSPKTGNNNNNNSNNQSVNSHQHLSVTVHTKTVPISKYDDTFPHLGTVAPNDMRTPPAGRQAVGLCDTGGGIYTPGPISTIRPSPDTALETSISPLTDTSPVTPAKTYRRRERADQEVDVSHDHVPSRGSKSPANASFISYLSKFSSLENSAWLRDELESIIRECTNYRDVMGIKPQGDDGVDNNDNNFEEEHNGRDWLSVTILANHPLVLEKIVVPKIISEMTDKQIVGDRLPQFPQHHEARKQQMVCALIGLGTLARAALQPLVDMLSEASDVSVDPRLIVLGIRSVGGSEGIHILCHIASSAGSGKLRSVALYGLGLLSHPMVGRTTVMIIGCGRLKGKLSFLQPSTSDEPHTGAEVPTIVKNGDGDTNGPLDSRPSNEDDSDELVLVKPRAPPYRVTHILFDIVAISRDIIMLLGSSEGSSRLVDNTHYSQEAKMVTVSRDFFQYAPPVFLKISNHGSSYIKERSDPIRSIDATELLKQFPQIFNLTRNVDIPVSAELSESDTLPGSTAPLIPTSSDLHSLVSSDPRIIETVSKAILSVLTEESHYPTLLEQAAVTSTLFPVALMGELLLEFVRRSIFITETYINKAPKFYQAIAALFVCIGIMLKTIDTASDAETYRRQLPFYELSTEVYAFLTDALERSGDLKVRHAACIAMGTAGSIGSVDLDETVIVILRSLHSGALSSDTACWALCRLGRAGIAMLTDLVIRRHVSKAIRLSAVEALGNMNALSVSTGAKVDVDQIIDGVVNALQDVLSQNLINDSSPGSSELSAAAVLAIGQLLGGYTEEGIDSGDPQRLYSEASSYYDELPPSPLVNILLPRLSHSAEPPPEDLPHDIIIAIMTALCRNGGPHGEVIVFQQLLQSKWSHIRAAAAVGLRYRGARVVRGLAAALDDAHSDVRNSAMMSLEFIGVSDILEVLARRPTIQTSQVLMALRDFMKKHVWEMNQFPNVLISALSNTSRSPDKVNKEQLIINCLLR